MPLPVPTQKIFDALYQAAKNKDKDALKLILSVASIGVRNQRNETAIGQLAFEKDIPSVNFLLTFGASLNDAVYGYAKGGHRDIIDMILTHAKQKETRQQAYSDTSENTGFITGITQFRAQILKSIEQIARLVEQLDTSLPSELCKINLGGVHVTLDEARFKKIRSSLDACNVFVGSSICVAMEWGYTSFPRVKPIFYKFISEKLKNGVFYDSFAEVEYALNQAEYTCNQEAYGGDMADFLRRVEEKPVSLLQRSAVGFALGGYAAAAYAFYAQIDGNLSDAFQLVKAFAQSGDTDNAYKLAERIKQSNPNEFIKASTKLAYGLALNGNKSTVTDYLKKIQPDYDAHPQLESNTLMQLAYGFAIKGYIKDVHDIIERMQQTCYEKLHEALPGIAYYYATMGFQAEGFGMLEKIKNLPTETSSVSREALAAKIREGLAIGLMTSDKKSAFAIVSEIIKQGNPSVLKKFLYKMVRMIQGNDQYALLESVARHHPEQISTLLDIMRRVEPQVTFDKSVALSILSVIDDALLRTETAVYLKEHNYCKGYHAIDLLQEAEINNLGMHMRVNACLRKAGLPHDTRANILTFLYSMDQQAAHAFIQKFDPKHTNDASGHVQPAQSNLARRRTETRGLTLFPGVEQLLAQSAVLTESAGVSLP